MKCSVCDGPINARNVSGRCKPCNARAALARRDYSITHALDWCPQEWRADYYKWTTQKVLSATEAKRVILEHIAIRGRA